MTAEIFSMAQEAMRLAFLTEGLGQLMAGSEQRKVDERSEYQPETIIRKSVLHDG